MDRRKIEAIAKGLERVAAMWTMPSLEEEQDELVRTARELDIPLLQLKHGFGKAKLALLTNKDWKRLENTDSWKVKTLNQARKLAKSYGKDISPVLEAFHTGHSLPAPIVLEYKDKLILIAGNTRLMISKILNKSPTVLWIKLP
jgi:hypothetical protein